MSISKEDIMDWKQNEVTKAVIKNLEEAAALSLEGIRVEKTSDQTAMKTAERIGFAEGCKSIDGAINELLEACE